MHKFSIVQKLICAKMHESTAKRAVLFFYTNVYGRLNVKNKKLFLQCFHAF